MMTFDVDARVDEAFWASSILPEGIVQRWFIAAVAPIDQKGL
jgi:hypothetical protein